MYIKLKNGQYLIREDLPKVKEIIETKSQEPINRIIVIDGSGSMWNEIDGLKQDVIKQVESSSATDRFTVGYFSSQGQWGWICKGAVPSDVRRLVEKFRFPMNMTCYSEILADIKNVIRDLTPISSRFSLLFQSDGFPNQNNNSIIGLLKDLAPLLATSMLVGYGQYYNRELMSQMASATGGILVHASNLSEFSKHLGNFREGSVTSEPRIEFPVPQSAKTLLVSFGKDGELVSHDLSTKTLYLSPNTKAIAYVADKLPNNVPPTSEETLLPTIYGVSRAALQLGNYNLALDLLAEIGDVAFIDRVNNSFTINEYGSVENDLLEAVDHDYIRFVKGQKSGYVPNPDAFCMLDLADLLATEEDGRFLPYHPQFEYKKIGRSTKQKDGFPKFSAGKDVEVKLNTFVWNSKKLNLGVLANIKGTIDLDKDAKTVGLDQLFNTFIWRNYALISDGKLNVTKLPVKNLSQATVEMLNANEVIESVTPDKVYILDLTKIPVINRKIADGYTDLNKVCGFLKKEKKLEVDQKVYKYLYGKLPQELQDQIDDLIKPSSFNDIQVAYLEKFGVKKDGSFAPETEKQEATDFLLVNEFEFGIKGLNSLPKIDEVLEKIAAKKKLTPIQEMVAESYNFYLSETAKDSEKSKALWLKERIEDVRIELRNIRSEINRAKFAVILGKSNFEQLPKLNEGKNEYEFDGLTFELKVNTNVRVDI